MEHSERSWITWACICCAGVLLARAAVVHARVEIEDVEARARDIGKTAQRRVFRDPGGALNLLHQRSQVA